MLALAITPYDLRTIVGYVQDGRNKSAQPAAFYVQAVREKGCKSHRYRFQMSSTTFVYSSNLLFAIAN